MKGQHDVKAPRRKRRRHLVTFDPSNRVAPVHATKPGLSLGDMVGRQVVGGGLECRVATKKGLSREDAGTAADLKGFSMIRRQQT